MWRNNVHELETISTNSLKINIYLCTHDAHSNVKQCMETWLHYETARARTLIITLRETEKIDRITFDVAN